MEFKKFIGVCFFLNRKNRYQGNSPKSKVKLGPLCQRNRGLLRPTTKYRGYRGEGNLKVGFGPNRGRPKLELRRLSGVTFREAGGPTGPPLRAPK